MITSYLNEGSFIKLLSSLRGVYVLNESEGSREEGQKPRDYSLP